MLGAPNFSDHLL